MQTKDSLYGNANYGVIDSNKAEMTGQDIPMPQVASKLAYPHTEGYFYKTMRDEATDILDKIIVITKKGHLKLSFKTNVFTNDGIIDVQILKLDASGVVARRRLSTNGYTEINFDVAVEVNDRFAIYLQANVGGALFQYIPTDGILVEQSAYILNLELIEPFDDIGSLVWSIDPILESFGSCIKLDKSRTLSKATYPLLYAKLLGTPYIINETSIDFTLVDFTQFPYLRTGDSLSVLEQNLPNPQITSTFSSNETGFGGEGTAKFGGNMYGDSSSGSFTGCFAGSDANTDAKTWGGEALAGSGFPTTNITLNVANHSHSISGTIKNTITNPNYSSTDLDVKLNTAQMFLYMICDNQL